VKQYKSVCVTLSFPDLTYICFKLFVLTVDKNNQLNRKNIRLIFWKSTKTALCIAFLNFFLCDSSLAFIISSKFSKIFHKQFTPSCLRPHILIIGIKSLVLEKYSSLILKIFFLWLKNYLLGRVPQLTGHLYFMV